MCGRYSLTRREEELIERFGIEQLLCDRGLAPRYNIAPSQLVPVIVNQEGKRVLCEFKWGLIPFWAKDLKKTKPVINARSESVAEKPFFKQALSKRRCLIPADGFYEWRQQNKEKIPMFIQINEGELFAFAGLWDQWTNPEGEVIRTCTIITTAANDAMTPVHDRMPVIIRPQDESTWLDPDIKEPADLIPLLEPLSNEAIGMHEVSSRVNSPAQDTPELVRPIEAAPIQGTLWELKK